METDVVVAFLTFLGTVVGAFFVNRSQLAKAKADAAQEREKLQAELAKVRAEAEASRRDDDREEIKALWAENRRLREETAQKNGSTDARISRLERDNADLKRDNQELKREVEALRIKACPWDRIGCARIGETAPVGAGKE